jgi:hypothetical protein
VLIETSAMSMTDIAFAAGFGSVRQFNDTVRDVYALAPTELRPPFVDRRCVRRTPGAVVVRLPTARTVRRAGGVRVPRDARDPGRRALRTARDTTARSRCRTGTASRCSSPVSRTFAPSCHSPTGAILAPPSAAPPAPRPRRRPDRRRRRAR